MSFCALSDELPSNSTSTLVMALVLGSQYSWQKRQAGEFFLRFSRAFSLRAHAQRVQAVLQAKVARVCRTACILLVLAAKRARGILPAEIGIAFWPQKSRGGILAAHFNLNPAGFPGNSR